LLKEKELESVALQEFVRQAPLQWLPSLVDVCDGMHVLLNKRFDLRIELNSFHSSATV
jgi:hypothetical protein